MHVPRLVISALLWHALPSCLQILWKYSGKYPENIPANILLAIIPKICQRVPQLATSSPSGARGAKMWRGDINGSRDRERRFLGFVRQMCKRKYWTTFRTEGNRNLKFSIEGDWNTMSPLNWLVRPYVTWCDIVTGWHGVTRWHGVTQRHDSSGCPSDWCHSCLPTREGSRVILWDLRTLYFLCNAKTN